MVRLLRDIEAGKIDGVVVYKVDRLSRSLLNFARMMEAFEKHRVSIISVTQPFNTANSMGRLVRLRCPGTDVPGLPSPSSSGRLSANASVTSSPPCDARASGPGASPSSATTSTDPTAVPTW
ncbi:MAG: recombinase family protein [Gemmataceae bacterium]|nr:recombinase family protein [Gemmataceae bacterium]